MIDIDSSNPYVQIEPRPMVGGGAAFVKDSGDDPCSQRRGTSCRFVLAEKQALPL